jgi:hypothetical protein
MAVSLDDSKTLEAIRILADVLDDLAGPDKLECLMAANALRQVLETQSETALGFARQAFESLEPSVRDEIRSEATEAAVKVMEQKQKNLRGPNQRLTRVTKPGGGILDALNGGLRTERKW